MSTTVIAVLGPIRSGTSCVAGMLHHLGLPMGVSWRPPDRLNPRGFFEDAGLHQIRKASFRRFFDTWGKNTYGNRVWLLKSWLHKRSHEGPIIGGKNPHLCKMVPEMDDAWPKWKAVVVVRPSEDVARSIPWFPRLSIAEKAKLVDAICRKRDADLLERCVSALTVQFADVLRNPAAVSSQLAAFCGLSPAPEQLAAAAKFVEPNLSHHTK